MWSSGRAALALLLAAFVARQVYAKHGGCENGYLPAPGCYTDGEWAYHESGDVTRIKTACTEVASPGEPWCMQPVYQVCGLPAPVPVEGFAAAPARMLSHCSQKHTPLSARASASARPGAGSTSPLHPTERPPAQKGVGTEDISWQYVDAASGNDKARCMKTWSYYSYMGSLLKANVSVSTTYDDDAGREW
jgi:hypothetical protein